MLQLIKHDSYTTKRPVHFAGPAPFAKKTSRISIVPNDKGLRFIFEPKQVTIPVRHTFIKDGHSQHTSILGNKNMEILHTEHILSALYGLEITSCDIILHTVSQIPDIDGSAQTFTDTIFKTGREKLPHQRKVIKITKDIFFQDKGSLAILRPSEVSYISALIQFPEPIGEQYYYFSCGRSSYRKEISWARSFIRRPVGKKGWNLARKELPRLPKDIKKSHIIVADRNANWIVTPKRKDEPVRHKIVDIVGDLGLLGSPIIGGITIVRPSHAFNSKLTQYLGGILKTI